MRTCTAELEGTAPYTQSRKIETKKNDKETHEDFELRIWPEHLHVDKDGFVFIPPMALKWAVESACRFMGLKIPGKGNATWAKRFSSGVLVLEPPSLNVKKEDVPCHSLWLNADGVRGSGKRVVRYFPKLDDWKATVTFHIVDDLITEEIFERSLREAGSFIGIGQFRPERGGYFGRFKVNKLTWG